MRCIYVVIYPLELWHHERFWKKSYTQITSPVDQFNKRWWEIAKQYQGIVPPSEASGEQYCDAASKTHINDDPAPIIMITVLSFILLFQLHDYISKKYSATRIRMQPIISATKKSEKFYPGYYAPRWKAVDWRETVEG